MLRGPVRFARTLLPANIQPHAIDSRGDCPPLSHTAASRRDETFDLEMLQGDGHPSATHSEHKGEKLVGKNEFLASDAVLCHEKRTGEPLFNLPMGVGQGRISRLHAEKVSET